MSIKDFTNWFKSITKSFDYEPMFKTLPLETEFKKEIVNRKVKNSQYVWTNYYVPMAVANIMKDKGVISNKDNKKVEYLANSMMFKDMADGKLNEFYIFTESEV